MPNRFAGPLVALFALAGAAAAADKVEAPKPQPAAHAGVGKMVPDLTSKAIDGTAFKLSDAMKGKKAAVVAITSATCPLSKKYLPTLAAFEKEYADKVAFVAINAISTDPPTDLKKLAAAAGLKAPLILDDGVLCKQLGATTTTDVFVLDAARTIKYRGAIDDQYGIGYSTDAPKHTYARNALEAVLAGGDAPVPATTAPGCALDLADVKAPAAVRPTYHNFASRLIQQNCQECHRKGGVGPFALETLDDVKAHKGMVKKVVKEDRMPVWNAAAQEKAGEPRVFKNDHSLPAADKEAFLAWIADGLTEGDKADAPFARTYGAGEWTIGKPDLVVQVPEPIKIKATGTMEYQNVVVDTGLEEDKWVVAAEILPTDRAVVHHVLVFALPAKKPGELELPRRGENQGYYAAYVPGNTRQILPEGFAKKLPKGARIKFQIHYTPNGTATKDQVKVGFKFGPTPNSEVKVFPFGNPKISIPPGAENHKEEFEFKLPMEVTLTAFSPHMHLRGKAARYEYDVIDPKTKKVVETKVLLDVPHYDFNWQLRYELAAPVTLPAGTPVRYIAWYDNSSNNPANPDPKKTVKWGDQTFDEMFLGYAEWYSPLLAVKKDEKK